jgi:hypothetical protein
VPPRLNVPAEVVDQAVALYREGSSIEAVAIALNLSYGVTRRELLARDVEFRPKGGKVGRTWKVDPSKIGPRAGNRRNAT